MPAQFKLRKVSTFDLSFALRVILSVVRGMCNYFKLSDIMTVIILV